MYDDTHSTRETGCRTLLDIAYYSPARFSVDIHKGSQLSPRHLHTLFRRTEVHTMHPALTDVKILGLVFASFDMEDQTCVSSVFAAALTCRTFLEPALNELWRDLNGLGNLVRCLPGDLWHTLGGQKGVVRLRQPKRPTTEADWVRFDFYAERVESITCSNATLPEAAVTDTVYRWLLSARPGRVLFPRLCSLQWGCDMNGHRREARFFDRGGILAVRLEASAAPCPHDPFPSVVAYLCHALSCTMPWSSAIDLQCGAAADMGAFQPSLADALASLDNLRWLNLGANQAIAFENFEALASLPLLEGLRVENNDSEVYLCSNAPWAADNESLPPERTFRALTYLKLELYHVQDAAVLLSSFAFPSLKKLYAVGIARSRSMHFWRIMRLATMRCSHDRLESIEIGSGKDDGMGPVDRAAGAITRASLEHLSVFPNLQRVTVFSEMSIVVDDDLIRELATAWPFLKSLSLISGCPDDNRSWRQTEMTLRGLAFLVQHCRELSWLGMDIDTSNADTLVPPSDEYHNPHLRSFHWVCEPPLLSDHAKVGAFLFALFPNLNYLGDDYEDEYTVPRWKPVMEIIKELQRQREAMEDMAL